MITTRIAIRLRRGGLELPTTRPYENGRVEEIAKRRSELVKELDQLDRELFALEELDNDLSTLEQTA